MRETRLVNKYVILGGLLVFLISCGLLYFIFTVVPFQIPLDATGVAGNAVTILPVSTFTPTAVPGTETAETLQPTAPSASTGLQVGQYAKIMGTGGAGLRIRSEPGLTAAVNFFGLDDEVFLITDGPVEVDAYTWWFLTAPYDETRSGWAASDFLIPIQQ